MLRVGLTGGIASGKSHVLARLAAAGCHTLDLDHVAHEVMAPGGPAYAEVVAAFGSGVLAPDGTLDRRLLGARVFADPEARARLNGIVHPKVRQEEARRVSAHASDPEAIFVTDAALLVESGLQLRFDRLVVVHCSAGEQLRRLMARDGIGREAALARIHAQMPAEEKRRFAHLAVDSSGERRATEASADALAGELRRIAASREPGNAVNPERALGCLPHGPSQGRLASLRLLREIADRQGVEMARLAALAGRPAGQPWYQADATHVLEDLAALTAPVVVWALAWTGRDHPFLMGALAAVARLTAAEPAAVADACLHGVALAEAISGTPAGLQLAARIQQARPEAERWGGAPSPLASDLIAFAARSAEGAALRPLPAAGSVPQPPPWARALLGALVGQPAGSADPALRAAVEAILRLRR